MIAPAPARDLPALAQIERMLAESYRRETDREENIWRSLPFFAATLALQLTVLSQVVERLPGGRGWPALAATVMIVGAMLCSLGALAFLASAIYPAQFTYIAGDMALLQHALGLIEDEADPAHPHPVVALTALQTDVAQQHALATDNNRQINRRRERQRSIAGLLTLASVLATLILVAITVSAYVSPSNKRVSAMDTPPIATIDPGQPLLAAASVPAPRQPPPMRVVTKGWFTEREELQTVAQVQAGAR